MDDDLLLDKMLHEVNKYRQSGITITEIIVSKSTHDILKEQLISLTRFFGDSHSLQNIMVLNTAVGPVKITKR